MATVNKTYPFMIKQCSKSETFSFVVVSEWNEAITEGLYNGAEQAFLENKVPAEHIIRWNVPGSFELMDVKNASNSKRRCCNCAKVIQGETKHFDFVCEGVAQGIKI
jgi:6,7-dimethyl-8-ribityllumazine synthase